jgi:hypothetical protein
MLLAIVIELPRCKRSQSINNKEERTSTTLSIAAADTCCVELGTKATPKLVSVPMAKSIATKGKILRLSSDVSHEHIWSPEPRTLENFLKSTKRLPTTDDGPRTMANKQ